MAGLDQYNKVCVGIIDFCQKQEKALRAQLTLTAGSAGGAGVTGAGMGGAGSAVGGAGPAIAPLARPDHEHELNDAFGSIFAGKRLK